MAGDVDVIWLTTAGDVEVTMLLSDGEGGSSVLTDAVAVATAGELEEGESGLEEAAVVLEASAGVDELGSLHARSKGP